MWIVVSVGSCYLLRNSLDIAYQVITLDCDNDSYSDGDDSDDDLMIMMLLMVVIVKVMI